MFTIFIQKEFNSLIRLSIQNFQLTYIRPVKIPIYRYDNALSFGK